MVWARFRSLTKILHDIIPLQDVSDLLQKIVDNAKSVAEADYCAIIHSPDGETFTVFADTTEDEEERKFSESAVRHAYLDRKMLEFCKKNLVSNSRAEIHLIQADFRKFHLAQKFSVILIACNTFSTLSENQRQTVLSRVKYHLTNRGLFAFSVPNPNCIFELSSESEPEVEAVFNHPVDGEPVQVSSSWTLDGSKWTLNWHYDHLMPDGTITRTSTCTTHYLSPASQFTREVKNAGFRNCVLFGDFDRSPYTEDSPYLISVSST